MIQIKVSKHAFLALPMMEVCDGNRFLFDRYYCGQWEAKRGAERLLKKFKTKQAKIVMVK